MSRVIRLTTTGAIGTTVIDDLGGVEFVHPVVSLDLVSPDGEFSYDEVINSTDTDTPTSSLQAAVNAGYITLSDAAGNPITDIGAFTINVATETVEGIVSITDQTFGGRKTFNDDRIIIDPTDAGTATTFEIGWFNDLTPDDPNSFGMRRTDGGGVFSWMNNANFPQLFLGSPTGTGTAFIDATNNRPLTLNGLDTGPGTPGLVTIGNGGLAVNSVDASSNGLTLLTDTGGTGYKIYVGSPGNFDNWLRFSAIGSLNSNEAVLLPAGEWRTQNGASGSPAHGFINGSNYGMYLGGANDLLCFSTAGIARLNIESDGTLNVANTTDYELLVLDDDDIPNKKYVDDAIAAIPPSGGGTGFIEYKFDNSTSMSNPGNGEFRYNNSNPSLVTAIAISDESEQGGDISTLIGFLAVGDVVYIQEVEDGAAFGIFQISSTVDNGSWWQLNVSVLDSGTLPDDGKECGVNFVYGGISSSTTDDLPEGSTNLYYTETRVSNNASVVANTAKVSADGSIGTHSDVDVTTFPPNTGDLIFYDGVNWRPADDGVTNQIRLLQDGCVLEVTDTNGLDFCNSQIGPTSGSAFYIAKRGLGTIAAPLPITNGTKIGGYSFLGVDGITSSPGYVSAEISSTAQEDFGVNAGANMLFEVTQVGTKITIPALEIEDDGTLSVAGQTDYELKVTSDDDIPNKKYVDDLLVQGDLAGVKYRRTTDFGLTTTPTFVPFDGQVVENDTSTVLRNVGDATRFDILDGGLYAVAINLSLDAGGAVNVTARLRLNNTSTVPGSEYTADPTNNPSAVTPWLLVEFNDNDFVQIQAETDTGTGDVVTDSSLALVKLAAPKGEKGDPGQDGLPGTGSTINLQEQDVLVPGGPHSTVNFASGFSVTDNGSGKATVALTGAGNFIRVFTNGGSDNTINYNTVGNTIVQFSGGTEGLGSDFTFDGANDWIVCNFDGWVEAGYNMPQFSTGARPSLETRLVKENVGGTTQDERAFDFTYIRNSSGHQRDKGSGETVYPVSNGEKIYVWSSRTPSSTPTAAVNVVEVAELIVKRIA